MAHFVGNAAGNAVKCLSFDSHLGLTEGIALVTGMPTGKNDGSYHPPHIKCGEKFLGLNRSIMPAISQSGDRSYVMKALLQEITPSREGARPFKVLSSYGFKTVDQLVYVRTALVQDPRIKSKFDAGAIRAWEGVIADPTLETILKDDFSGDCLLLFTEDGQEADVYLGNATVWRVARDDGEVSARILSRKETAEARVAQYESQLEQLDDSADSVKRKHGVLGGAIRLLHLAKSDVDSRHVLVEFLWRHQDDLMSKMKDEVINLLASWNDTARFKFMDQGKVVNLTLLREHFKGTPADEKKRKQERAMRDRAERALRKGSSNPNPGKQKKEANGKK